MKLLPNWLLTPGLPVSNDFESSTFPEMVYKIYGKMNELITEYNKFVDDTNTKLADFVEKYNQDIEEFTLAMRQEFQDFIDTVDLKFSDLASELRQEIAELGTFDTSELEAQISSLQSSLTSLESSVNEQMVALTGTFENRLKELENTSASKEYVDESIENAIITAITNNY